MAIVSRKCPYCDTKISFDLDSTASAVMCRNCGERVERKKFPAPEGQRVPFNIDLENAKSLRAIAVSLDVLSENDTRNREWDVDVVLAKLEAARVKPFE